MEVLVTPSRDRWNSEMGLRSTVHVLGELTVRILSWIRISRFLWWRFSSLQVAIGKAMRWSLDQRSRILGDLMVKIFSWYHVSWVWTSFLWISRSVKLRNGVFVVLWFFTTCPLDPMARIISPFLISQFRHFAIFPLWDFATSQFHHFAISPSYDEGSQAFKSQSKKLQNWVRPTYFNISHFASSCSLMNV